LHKTSQPNPQHQKDTDLLVFLFWSRDMPYSGNGTEAEIEQRRKAARKHGVDAIRRRGQAAMTPGQRGHYTELQEQLSTREGAVDALRDAAVNTIMLAQVAQSYCVEQHQGGKPLDQIPLLRSLPAFWNSAGRALKVYLETLPDDKEVLDLAEHIKQAMGGDGDE
jgi:hypothetical protein